MKRPLRCNPRYNWLNRGECVNHHAYWYLGLSALSLLALGCTCYAKRSLRRPLLLFGIVVGYGFIIESIIYNFLGSYRYDPNLIAWNDYYDSNTGALASNALALPVAATMIAVLGLGWTGIVGFAILFGSIEWLFLHLEIYEHYWWRTVYTMFGLPFYFGTAIWLYPRLTHPVGGLLHKLLLYAFTAACAGIIFVTPIIVFDIRSYTPGWFAESGRDTTSFSDVFFGLMSLMYVWLACLNWRHAWLKYAISAAVMQGSTILLRAAGLLHSHLWWDGLYYALAAILMTRLSVAFHRTLLQEE
jgi:hypothetical protein